MTPIQPHGEVTVRHSGAVRHPLAGDPQFIRVEQCGGQSFARVEDGDLVLRIGDAAAAKRWSEALGLAAVQLRAAGLEER